MKVNYGNYRKPVLQEKLNTGGSPQNERRIPPHLKVTQTTQKSELVSNSSYLQARQDQRRASADEIVKLMPQDQDMLVLPKVRLH